MKVQRTGRAALLLAAGSLALSACGSDAGQVGTPAASSSDGAALTGTLNGGGSSAQESAMEAWRAGFSEASADVTVNYEPVGSGSGREQFLAGGLAFAGSDAALKAEELEKGATRCPGGAAVDLPLYISPVAVVFNLEGVDELKLDAPVLADIFNQKITKWDDPAIAALNAGVTLPSVDITPVNRQDSSGTTENFTDFLAQGAADKWPYKASGTFPVMGGEAANGTSALVAAVKGGNGTIGYADFSRAEGLGVAQIEAGTGFVSPSAETATAAVDAAERVSGRPEGDITLELPRTPSDPSIYPITLVAYSIVCTSYPDAAQGALVKAFFEYVASEDGQAAAAENAKSAPISEQLRGDVLATLARIKTGA